MQILLQRIQYHSDQQAFKQFYQLTFFKLYRFAYTYVQSKENAEEIVNDVFLNIWQKRDTLHTIVNIDVYLYVAVKNASLNYLRSNKQKTPLSINDLNVCHLESNFNSESLLTNHELQNRLQTAIRQLPPRCRLVFQLIKQDGLSYKEVAAILDISIKTVDTQLYLALKKLTHILHPVWA